MNKPPTTAELDAKAAWEASPNRAFDGKKCSECGFDNRFHAEDCLFQSPSLRITGAAFNALHDENQTLVERVKADAELIAELAKGLRVAVDRLDDGSAWADESEELVDMRAALAKVEDGGEIDG